MNIEQAMQLTNMRKQATPPVLEGQETKTAKEMAELVFELSASVGDPYRNATPEVWAKKWLPSRKFTLVDIDPRQVAVPYVNKIAHSKVMAIMQASAVDLPPVVVDLNAHGIGKTTTGYVPSIIVVDGKNRHRAQVLCGRDRISAWVGEKALDVLQARASARKTFVVAKAKTQLRPLSKIEIAAALSAPSGGSPVSVARQDTGDGGSRPTGSTHRSVRGPMRGGAGGPGGSLGSGSGLNPQRMGMYSDADPSDKNGSDPSDTGQMIDPSDKSQFAKPDEPDSGDPFSQSPGSGVGPRVKPSMKAGPITVKKIRTDKKKRKMQAVAPPGFGEDTMHKLKQKHGTESAFKIAWSSYNKGRSGSK